jgi:transcriptional regulator with XRE-family HTH domain
MAAHDVPALVQSIRKRTGWTQEQLARELGVSFSTVNCWERGRRKPQPFLLKRLLEIARGATA